MRIGGLNASADFKNVGIHIRYLQQRLGSQIYSRNREHLNNSMVKMENTDVIVLLIPIQKSRVN